MSGPDELIRWRGVGATVAECAGVAVEYVEVTLGGLCDEMGEAEGATDERQHEMFSHPDAVARFPDIRFVHLQIWVNVGIDGIRLTELAERAALSLAACSELVNDLESLGYLERRPDPTDGRAKPIHPTPRGRELLAAAGDAVAEIEARWRLQCEPGSFDAACRTLDGLIYRLDLELGAPANRHLRP